VKPRGDAVHDTLVEATARITVVDDVTVEHERTDTVTIFVTDPEVGTWFVSWAAWDAEVPGAWPTTVAPPRHVWEVVLERLVDEHLEEYLGL
jgi:hypothetical protein